MLNWQELQKVLTFRAEADKAKPSEGWLKPLKIKTSPYTFNRSLDWQVYTDIADKFQIKARFEDREDLRQDIIVRLAELALRNGREHLSKPAMLRIASYVATEYWRDLKRQPSLSSLNADIEDDEGNTIELYQTIADDKAIDLERWLEAKTWLAGCPRRLIQIAYKKAIGKPLNAKDKMYLSRWRQKELAKTQKALL